MRTLALAAPFLTALLVSVVASLACERLAPRVRLIAHPRDDRWHRERVPLLGGVAIMLAVVGVGVELGDHLGRFAPLLVLSVSMGVVGLVDDVKTLRPQTKLAAQLVGTAILIQFGTLLPLTPFAVVNLLITLVWMVAITNAFNLLDNMDGLAAGVAALTALFRLSVFVIDGDRDGAWMMAALLGAVCGFLIRNYPPAKISVSRFTRWASSLIVVSRSLPTLMTPPTASGHLERARVARTASATSVKLRDWLPSP